jgi:hypothetical protein
MTMMNVLISRLYAKKRRGLLCNLNAVVSAVSYHNMSEKKVSVLIVCLGTY